MSSTVWIFYLIFLVATIAGFWQVFEKAGEAGWKSIIPIWNTLVLLRIVGRPIWWIVLFLIPIVGFVAWILVASDLSKSFGRGVRPRWRAPPFPRRPCSTISTSCSGWRYWRTRKPSVWPPRSSTTASGSRKTRTWG